MPNATTDTRIIFVHGMGAKPPAEDLHALYKKALIENVRIDNGSLAADMESNGTLFVSAYWANAPPKRSAITSNSTTPTRTPRANKTPTRAMATSSNPNSPKTSSG